MSSDEPAQNKVDYANIPGATTVEERRISYTFNKQRTVLVAPGAEALIISRDPEVDAKAMSDETHFGNRMFTIVAGLLGGLIQCVLSIITLPLVAPLFGDVWDVFGRDLGWTILVTLSGFLIWPLIFVTTLYMEPVSDKETPKAPEGAFKAIKVTWDSDAVGMFYRDVFIKLTPAQRNAVLDAYDDGAEENSILLALERMVNPEFTGHLDGQENSPGEKRYQKDNIRTEAEKILSKAN